MVIGSSRKILLASLFALLFASGTLAAQSGMDVDSDQDGLNDALEQRLLVQFAPRFMVAEDDCSIRPAAFMPEMRTPRVGAEDGTIYGQVFRAKSAPVTGGKGAMAEIHYYHLWRSDCGDHGHPLDTEHVAVLVSASGDDLSAASWKAVYWYAAAHEDTVCDVSQIARATTLHAEEHGATVWISSGKHASYLNATLCRRGCGADRCENMVALQTSALVNLGEPGHPMNGALFISSTAWPLLGKMSQSNFPAAPVERLRQLPETEIAWFNPGRHPAQGIIAHSNATKKALSGGGRSGADAISHAGDSTGSALSSASDSSNSAMSVAADSTGSALKKSYQHTRHALGVSIEHMGKVLKPRAKEDAVKPE